MSSRKAAIRCQALDMAGLAIAEAHAKRLDRTSRRRAIRDLPPLVAGGLDLRRLFDAHVRGARRNKAAKKLVLHFLVRFPPELLGEAEIGRFRGDRTARQKAMLHQAVTFIQRTHGGKAVFAARVDRDEAGETIVDVFAAPTYEKRTKRMGEGEPGVTWVSATRFGKALAMRNEQEIRRRHPEAKSGALTSPRMVGIALQSEFARFFQDVNGVELTRKVEKRTRAPDRIEIEAYKHIQQEREALARRKSDLVQLKDELVALRGAVAAEAFAAAVKAVCAVFDGKIGPGKTPWTLRVDRELREELRPVLPLVGPSLKRLSDWWDPMRQRIEALPEAERATFAAPVDDSPGWQELG